MDLQVLITQSCVIVFIHRILHLFSIQVNGGNRSLFKKSLESFFIDEITLNKNTENK